MIIEDVKFFEVPKEMMNFFNDVFELYEIRERVGECKGIKFVVHTNETNHNIPHVHAEYDKYNISISLIDFSILVGNIPDKNKKIAIKWVKENKEYILSKWNDKTLTSTLILHKSRLDFK